MCGFTSKVVQLTTATALVTMVGTATGLAEVFKNSGGALLQVETRSDDTRRITSEPYFSCEILPNSQIRITIPEDEGSRLIIARFAA
jgi:hypothetical protein